jgi:hypothetical protein
VVEDAHIDDKDAMQRKSELHINYSQKNTSLVQSRHIFNHLSDGDLFYWLQGRVNTSKARKSYSWTLPRDRFPKLWGYFKTLFKYCNRSMGSLPSCILIYPI